jgi:hypothetical protein
LDDDNVAATCAGTLRVPRRDKDSHTGKPVVCTRRFVEKFLADYNLGKYKTSAIDPKRAKQATCEVRVAWFDLIDRVVVRAFDNGQTPWPKAGDVRPTRVPSS